MSETYPVCFRCALVNPTCCRTDPTHTHACFPLSVAEIERLAPHALECGVPAFQTEENTQAFLNLMRFLFPDRRAELDKAFPLRGQHYRLPLDADGKCMFLLEDGCSLPRSARPWYCQLFPVWIRKGFFDRFAPEACLVTHEARSLGEVFEAVGLTREKAKEMYLALCRDWGLEKYDSE